MAKFGGAVLEFCSNICPVQAAFKAVWVENPVLRPESFKHRRSFMEDRALAQSSNKTTNSSATRRETRSVWVLTCYGICGLALFGILLYYFSTYVTH